MFTQIPAVSSLLALVSLTAAASLPSATHQAVPSQVSSTQMVANSHPSAVAVDPSRFPDWAGELDPADCVLAWYIIFDRAKRYPDSPVTFWSQQWSRHQPEGLTFRLPFGSEYGMSHFPLPEANAHRRCRHLWLHPTLEQGLWRPCSALCQWPLFPSFTQRQHVIGDFRESCNTARVFVFMGGHLQKRLLVRAPEGKRDRSYSGLCTDIKSFLSTLGSASHELTDSDG